ncbi:hypothetical protein BURPS1106B_A2186 [Burkholderia pseudomallei 1106b]|uniref:Uncharacterized protein n=1 Tax=Burkholderia pseudomallei (strain 1106a) TaxID=357348 RepID=A3NXZ2_BURP0|nr:hypothetical protein BURPS1106A_2969 [Burkholderia pseudomallei 1106a]EES25054.1 hypothetical protein BURPS1106B_A2186 [Burkholderia pseudomallei 1106b]
MRPVVRSACAASARRARHLAISRRRAVRAARRKRAGEKEWAKKGA